LIVRKLIYCLKSTSNSPEIALISDTSRDTRSNFVPRWINFTTLSQACRVLITTDHSPWIVGSATTATTQTKAATGSGHREVSAIVNGQQAATTGNSNSNDNGQGQRRRVAAIGRILLDITVILFKF
jgi:hypothetical protein